MKRVGKCRMCGACCTTRKLWTALTIWQKLASVLLSRGKVLKGLWKNERCRFLYRSGVNTFKCSQYNTRPFFCREYPGDVDDLIKGCGFNFTENNGKN